MSRATRTTNMIIAVAAGLLVLILFGIVGLMRDGDHLIDMMVFYIAGEWHWTGVSPYGHVRTPPDLLAQGLYFRTYSYPPHFAPFAMALALPAYSVAEIAVMVINVAASVVLAWAVLLLTRLSARTTALQESIIAFAIIASPFAAHVVWLGNTSLIVAAALALGWYFMRLDRDALAGLCLGLASIKPQFVVFLFIWLLLCRRWSVIFYAALTVAVLMMPQMIHSGPYAVVAEWLQGIHTYRNTADNTLGARHLFGVDSVAHAVGIDMPLVLLALFSATGIILLWVVRDHLDSVSELSLLLALAALMLPVHDYDLVVLMPILGAYIAITRGKTAMLIGLNLLLLFYLPQRLLADFGQPLLLHWREILLVAVAIWLYRQRIMPSTYGLGRTLRET